MDFSRIQVVNYSTYPPLKQMALHKKLYKKLIKLVHCIKKARYLWYNKIAT